MIDFTDREPVSTDDSVLTGNQFLLMTEYRQGIMFYWSQCTDREPKFLLMTDD